MGSACSGFEPTTEDVVFPTTFLVALAAFVLIGVGRLNDDEAFEWLVFVGAERLTLQQLCVVGVKVVAEKGETKAAAALKAAVATTAVAAEATDERADVPLEAGLLSDLGGGVTLFNWRGYFRVGSRGQWAVGSSQ